MGINTAKLVDSFIKKLPAGETFASAELLKFGSRANLDKVLSRLVGPIHGNSRNAPLAAARPYQMRKIANQDFYLKNATC